MAEWLKAHAWKACILQKGIGGSNPSLSASLRSERSTERRLPRRSAKHEGGPGALCQDALQATTRQASFNFLNPNLNLNRNPDSRYGIFITRDCFAFSSTSRDGFHFTRSKAQPCGGSSVTKFF